MREEADGNSEGSYKLKYYHNLTLKALWLLTIYNNVVLVEVIILTYVCVYL